MTDCWRKGEEWKEAECRYGHRIPGDRCSCGIWAFYDVEHMLEKHGNVLAPLGDDDEPYQLVSGVIGAGGDIVLTEWGFRAEYAKVLGIFEDEWPTPKSEIAKSYHCPIVAPSDYGTFCTERGLIRLDR
jgi:hypothetical protein